MRCSKEGRHLWTTRARGCQNQCEVESLIKNKTQKKIMIRRHQEIKDETANAQLPKNVVGVVAIE